MLSASRLRAGLARGAELRFAPIAMPVTRRLRAQKRGSLLARAAFRPAAARAFSTARGSYSELRGPTHYPLIGALPFFQKHGGAEGLLGVNRALYSYGNLVSFSIFGDETLVVFDPAEFLKIHRAAGKMPSGSTTDLCAAAVRTPSLLIQRGPVRKSVALACALNPTQAHARTGAHTPINGLRPKLRQVDVRRVLRHAGRAREMGRNAHGVLKRCGVAQTAPRAAERHVRH